MAAPVFVACPAGAWTKVATNVTAGTIWFTSQAPNSYLHTYKPTGVAAPTLQSEGVKAPVIGEEGDSPSIPIAAAAGIDVYVWALGAAGQVRVDV